jgi:Flp pilus assembly protein TadG
MKYRQGDFTMKRQTGSCRGRRPLLRLPHLTRGLRRHIGNRTRNEEGVAAIEFALVLPFLIMLLVGSIEMFLMSMASRKMTRVASTVGDLVTQAKGALSKSAIEDYYRVSKYIMGSFDTNNLALSIFTFTKDSRNSSPRLAWRQNLGSYTCQASVPSLTADQRAAMQDGNDLVITFGCYRYQVKIGKLVFGNLHLTMRDDISLRPRQRMKLPCNDCS